MTHPDHRPYFRFTKPQRVETAVNTLDGILSGIAIDGVILDAEFRELTGWCNDHRDLLGQHPFEELLPRVRAALADGRITEEEKADIAWVCKNLSIAGPYYNQITRDIQVLHGVLHGILADGVITEDEAKGLRQWTKVNSHLKGTYPFDELDSLLTTVLRAREGGPGGASISQGFL